MRADVGGHFAAELPTSTVETLKTTNTNRKRIKRCVYCFIPPPFSRRFSLRRDSSMNKEKRGLYHFVGQGGREYKKATIREELGQNV